MLTFSGKNVLVVGLGVTGIATSRFLKARGASVTVTDLSTEKGLSADAASLMAEGIRMELGIHQIETFQRADLVLLSPGVSHNILPVKAAREKGIPVWGEIELSSRLIREPIVAITGTNGKTTTTRLVGDMLMNSGYRVFVGGNIGNPLIEYVTNREKADIVVAEVSSFQLDTIETFRPKIGVLLNVTPDHLDRYPDFPSYVESKTRLFENQRNEDVAILNGSDQITRELLPKIRSKKLFFNADSINEPGATLVGQQIHIDSKNILSRADGKHRAEKSEINSSISIDLSSFKLTGRHNLENASASCLAALAAGGTPEGIKAAIDRFEGLPHRLEYVDSIRGVAYYNDSKATNVDAVVRALEAFDNPLILIMGGRNKGGRFESLKKPVSRRVKAIILMGEAKDEILSALGNLHDITFRTAASMEDSVSEAYRIAVAGEVVLLSPACASFDMYSDYKQRGKDFCYTVKKLKANSHDG